MKLYKSSVVAIVTVSSVLMLSGCDSQDTGLNITRPEVVYTEILESATVKPQSMQPLREASLQTEPMPVSKISSELSAKGTIGAISNIIQLDTDQKACLNDFDKYFAVEDLESYFQTNYSPEELKTLNNYFNSELGVKATKYSSKQMMQVFGGDAPNQAEAPSEAEMMKIAKMSQDPAFVKYNNFSLQQGEGSLQELIKPLLMQELKKCNISNNAQ